MIPSYFREALALHSIFEAFGIPTEDIFVVYGEHKRFQVVAKQGLLEFRVDVADLDLEKTEFIIAWMSIAAEYNAMPQAKRIAITESTKMRKQAVEIIGNMVMKGFRARTKRSN